MGGSVAEEVAEGVAGARLADIVCVMPAEELTAGDVVASAVPDGDA